MSDQEPPEVVQFLGMDFVVIHSYGIPEAVADGILTPLFLDQGKYPEDGKQVIATTHLLDSIGVEATLKVWDDFQVWKRNVMPTLPEEDRLYAPTVDGFELFVIEDAVAYTLMLREDY